MRSYNSRHHAFMCKVLDSIFSITLSARMKQGKIRGMSAFQKTFSNAFKIDSLTLTSVIAILHTVSPFFHFSCSFICCNKICFQHVPLCSFTFYSGKNSALIALLSVFNPGVFGIFSKNSIFSGIMYFAILSCNFCLISSSVNLLSFSNTTTAACYFPHIFHLEFLPVQILLPLLMM